MPLEDGPLKILHGVGLAVEVRYLVKLLGDGITLLGQAAMGIPVFEEHAADVLARLHKQVTVGFGVGQLVGCAIGVLLVVSKYAEQREQHVIRRPVLRMHLEHGSLKILNSIGAPIEVALLLKRGGDRETLLSQTAVCVPISQKRAAYRLARFFEGL